MGFGSSRLSDRLNWESETGIQVGESGGVDGKSGVCDLTQTQRERGWCRQNIMLSSNEDQ